ncbi:MAG: glycosyltransferase family 2 protein [Pseudomonadota bacterium]
MQLSICIPTYNRSAHLRNCLNSTILNRSRERIDFEICVSDNASTDDTPEVVRRAQEKIPIRYQRQSENLGMARNILRVVEMAKGDFVWIVGDDDLLLPHALEKLSALIQSHPSVEYFYINSWHLSAQHVLSLPQPFDTSDLPTNMKPFSPRSASGEMMFFDLIDPDISFDFLGGVFLSVFRREAWIRHVDVLDPAALSDSRTFSNLDNTFPHVKIFSKAFASSRAFYRAEPLSVCLTGAREWAPLYPLIRSVRFVEILNEHRKNGLHWFRYLRCRHRALHCFLPDLFRMYSDPKRTGLAYIRPLRLVLSNCLFPNFYLSPFYFLLGGVKSALCKLFKGRGRPSSGWN